MTLAIAHTLPAEDGSSWTAQAEPGLCSLGKTDDRSSSILSVSTKPGSDSYRVAIVTPADGTSTADGAATLSFLPSQHSIEGYGRTLRLADGRRVVLVDGLQSDVLDRIAANASLTLTMPGARGAANLSGSAQAIAALRRCSADQLEAWGADPNQFAPGGAMPIATIKRDDWLSNRQLLAVMGASRRAALDATFQIAISAGGTVDDCQPLDQQVEAGVVRVACAAVLNRQLFTPAKDAEGRGVRGAATFRIQLQSRPGP